MLKQSRIKRFVLITLITVALTACASQTNQKNMQQIPVIQLGETTPANGEYILYLPAGKNIATTVNIVGDMLNKEASQVLQVQLKRDIYSYKNWISYDKKNWLDAQDAISISMDLKLPGYDYPHAGKITLRLSEKN